jgi:hypothetical protein
MVFRSLCQIDLLLLICLMNLFVSATDFIVLCHFEHFFSSCLLYMICGKFNHRGRGKLNPFTDFTPKIEQIDPLMSCFLILISPLKITDRKAHWLKSRKQDGFRWS